MMKNKVLYIISCLCLLLQTPVWAFDEVVDKKVLDERITERIMYGSTERIEPADFSQFTLHKIDSTGILCTQGNIYMIDKICDDLYFSSWGDTLQILWDRRYPEQSLSNLLLGQIAKPEFFIDLTHRRYGTEYPRLHVSWASLYHTLCTEGARPYASSLIKEDELTLRGILVIHQPQGNYLHMLVITTTIDQLFSTDVPNPELKADLFTNVPQHNILNLYE